MDSVSLIEHIRSDSSCRDEFIRRVVLTKSYKEKYRTLEEFGRSERLARQSIYNILNRKYEDKETHPPVVYFVGVVERFVKIGYSRAFSKRLECLQTACPFELQVLAFISGATQKHERKLHRKFAHLLMRGEWFSWGDDLASFISEIGDR